MKNRYKIVFLLFLGAVWTGCQPAAKTPNKATHPEYIAALTLHTRLAATGQATLVLVPPPGYHKAEDTADKVFVEGANLQAVRDGLIVNFSGVEEGDKAWVEAYYCPVSEATGLCTFRPIEVLFTGERPQNRNLSLPDPAPLQ